VEQKAEVLVVAAHPDDAELGAGGAVALWTRQGRRVVYIICTNGDKGADDRTIRPEDLAAMREREQQSAAAALGVSEVVFLRYPDQGLEDTPAFRKHIVQLIRTYRPFTVVTSDPYRRYIMHRDHRIVGQVCLDAVYPFARDALAYPDLISQGLEPHKVSEMLFWFPESSNYRVDITATFAAKTAALKCHQSQISGFGAPDVEAWLRDMCRKMAAGEPFELAEAFQRIEVPT
jgi:LmbE family N-acetylglucosaminyl deacetylase